MAKDNENKKKVYDFRAIINGLILAGIIGLFAFISDSKTNVKINDIKIQENQKKIDKNSENVEYLQKTVNVTNNTVTEIKFKLEDLPTMKDFEKFREEMRKIMNRHDRNETAVK